MRGLATVFLALVLVAPHGSAADTLDQIRETGKLRIGFRTAEPPMSFVDQNGQAVGYSIEICMRIAKAVQTKLQIPNLKVELLAVDASNRFEALTENTIDILCGSTTKTLSRSELVDFTQLTFVTGASLMSLAENQVGGITGLEGRRVAVVSDTTTIVALKDALSATGTSSEVVPVESAADGMKALVGGEVDAFSSDQVVLIGLILNSGGKDRFVVSPELFSFEPFALAVRRNDADFRLVADRVLSELYRSGQIDSIYARWFGAFARNRPALVDSVYRINATPE